MSVKKLASAPVKPGKTTGESISPETDSAFRYWCRSSRHEHAARLPDNNVTLVFYLAGGRITPLSHPPQQRGSGGPGQASLFFKETACAWQCDGAMVYLQVSFSSGLLEQYLQQPGTRMHSAAFPASLWFIDDANLNRLGLVLADLVRRHEFSDRAEQTAWVNLLANYLSRHLRVDLDGPSAAASDVILQATRFIDGHLHEPLSVSHITEQLSVPRKELTRKFKQNTGRSPYRFILERRLLRARELLVTTDESLAEIAYRVGFSSQSHMTSTFHRLVGMTPLEIREQNPDLT
jgi:AraC-like DNA-binding protein